MAARTEATGAEEVSNMALGYCKVCDRLLPLERRVVSSDRETIQLGRQVAGWFPISHPALGDDMGGAVCIGTRRPL